jgi:hypothetical protein
MSRHQGGCQCRKVRFVVEVGLEDLITCNCSRCSRVGSILAFVAEEDFTLLQGQDALTDYRFNTGKISHLFCSECGIESFGLGEGPGGVRMAAINVRCLDDVDVFALEPIQVNGKTF